MNFNILSADLAHLNETEEISRRPAFRKATRNIALATAVLEKTLKPLNNFFKQNHHQFALVLTSQSGELETTFDFLKTLHQDKLARPLLFQNSLHNTTAGFLSIQFALTSPVITSSSSPFGTEQALEIAGLLLSQEQCQYCIVLSVDVWPKLKDYETSESIAVDGAACMVLSHPQALLPDLFRPLGYLTDIEISSSGHQDRPDFWQPLPLSQNLLYQLVYQLKLQQTGSLSIDRGRCGISTVQTAPWEQAAP